MYCRPCISFGNGGGHIVFDGRPDELDGTPKFRAIYGMEADEEEKGGSATADSACR